MRDQKKYITKQGFEMIFTEGLRSFTVDRLSSVLRMSKKTIYSLFSTKEILIEQIIKYKLRSIESEIEGILKKNKCPILSFYEINQLQIKTSADIDVNKLVELKVKYPQIWARIERHRRKGAIALESIFTDAKKLNYLRKDLEIKLISNLYINIIDRTFQPEFFIQQEVSLKDTIELFAGIMAKGIFNQEGIAILENIKKRNLK